MQWSDLAAVVRICNLAAVERSSDMADPRAGETVFHVKSVTRGAGCEREKVSRLEGLCGRLHYVPWPQGVCESLFACAMDHVT